MKLKFLNVWHRGTELVEEGWYPCLIVQGPFKSEVECQEFLAGIPGIDSIKFESLSKVN